MSEADRPNVTHVHLWPANADGCGCAAFLIVVAMCWTALALVEALR